MRKLASPDPFVSVSDRPFIMLKTYFVQGMVKVRKYGMSAKGSNLDSYTRLHKEVTYGVPPQCEHPPLLKGSPKAHRHPCTVPKNQLGLRRIKDSVSC